MRRVEPDERPTWTAVDGGDDGPIRRTSTRLLKGTSIAKPSNIEGTGLGAILLHWLNILLIGFPIGIYGVVYGWSQVSIFWLMFTSMIPMAKILGDATEELAAGLKNEVLAGLLNATFGNAVEMVIAVQTLRKGLFLVVKATLLGSVLSNMLLVLGMSFFCGGIFSMSAAEKKAVTAGGSEVEYSAFHAKEKVQHFGILGAMVNTSMLLLSCLSFSLVTVFASITQDGLGLQGGAILPVSRICSMIMASAYVAYILFQLVTHRDVMNAEDEEEEDGEGAEGEPTIAVSTAITLLFVISIIVAIASEFLVDAIHDVTERAHLTEHFIGIILLPIVGNACEHAAAVRFGMMDKPGLSLGIAVGSSTQIALFVVPFSVIVGWCIGQPMDLNFGPLNTTVMTLSVIVMLSMVVDGQSNWLQGYLLCAAYAVVAVLYAYVPDKVSGIWH